MSHNVLQVQADQANASGAITGTISEEQELGTALNNASGQAGTGSGNYIAGDNYVFLTGSDTYTGKGVTISGDTIKITGGIFLILCCPTFGGATSTPGNTELRAQFQDSTGEALGNIGVTNRASTVATYPGSNMFAAYVEGPRDVHLKITAINAGSFPNNATETANCKMFIEIIRIT